jgi:hypothetical protein
MGRLLWTRHPGSQPRDEFQRLRFLSFRLPSEVVLAATTPAAIA